MYCNKEIISKELVIEKIEYESANHVQRVRRNYVVQHKDLSLSVMQAVTAGTVILGMKQDDVIASCGNTNIKNEYVGKFGRHDQWVYDDRNAYSDYNFNNGCPKYIFFENGILISWQNS